MLRRGGSAEQAKGVQWFFKEEVKSYGWRTADLRKAALRWRSEILKQFDLDFLLQTADRLYRGKVNEDKNAAVFLLENMTGTFGNAEFRVFESWLPRISNWSDHDALLHYLIAPMIVAKPERVVAVFRWAKSRDRWHRRAACVALIQGTRRKLFLRKSHGSLISCSLMRTIWCRKGWDGCCGRQQRLIPKELCRICCESALALRAWCCEPPARHCRRPRVGGFLPAE